MITIICTSCLRLTDDCGEDDEAEGERCKYDDNQVKILHQGKLQRLSSFSDRGEQQTTDDTISYWSRFASSIKLLNIKLKGLPSPKRCHSHQGVFINYVTGGTKKISPYATKRGGAAKYHESQNSHVHCE